MIIRNIIFIGLIGVVLSCATPSHNPFLERRPANESSKAISEEEIVRYFKYVLDFRSKEADVFKVVRLPINDASDISPSDAMLKVAQIMEAVDTPSESAAIAPLLAETEDHPLKLSQFHEIILNRFTRAQRDELAKICFLGAAHVGDRFYVSTFLMMNTCRWVSAFHDESEVRDALLMFPKKPEGVRYDGQYGYHVYTNKKLENHVQILTAAINTNRVEFYKMFHALPKSITDKFTTNTDRTDEASKIEPFDLLATYTTSLIIRKGMGTDLESGELLNKIQISKLSQKGLARLFHMMGKGNEAVNKLPSVSMIRNDSAVTLLCANGMFDSRKTQVSGDQVWYRGYNGTDLIEWWNPSRNLQQFVSKGFSAVNLTCNSVDYRVVFQNLPMDPIPAPREMDLSTKSDVHALMTISLTSEIDRTAVETARMFVKSLTGWEVVGDIESVDTLQFMGKYLPRVDAYFPVMHAMDVNYFHVGTKNSLLLRMDKKVKNLKGNETTLHLAVLLPDSSKMFESVILKPDDLAKMLDRRYQVNPSPLFLMNNSCASEKTLMAWTLVYRRALAVREARGDRNSQVRDFPHIIGSKRYFGTSSLIEIFSHSNYPLKSLEMLGQGQSVAKIVEFLSTPQDKGFISGLTGFFKDNKEQLSEAETFEPVYIMDYPELLSTGGIKISVTSRAVKGTDEY